MQQIFYFFQRFKYFLYFLFLTLISFILTFNNFEFHKSKFINSANTITGGIFEKGTNISEYFRLKEQNELLVKENNLLRNLIEKNNIDVITESTVIDSINFNQKYTYTSAKIINNNYNNSFNYLTINKGDNAGIDKEMAVINSKGIIGITDNANSKYTRVQSILNRNSKINARLKNSNYFGTLSWDGIHYNTVQLADLPRQTPLKIGDTIETGGKSAIFPEGILIGYISEINKGNSANNKVAVTLFNDMSNLDYVYVIKNWDKLEIKSLENSQNEQYP